MKLRASNSARNNTKNGQIPSHSRSFFACPAAKQKARKRLFYKHFRAFTEKMGFEPMPHSSHATPLAGEPLGPLGYFSIPYGERGIRTPGAFRHHWFSRPAPSTPRPSLLKPAKRIIPCISPPVNPIFPIFTRGRENDRSPSAQSFARLTAPPQFSKPGVRC